MTVKNDLEHPAAQKNFLDADNFKNPKDMPTEVNGVAVEEQEEEKPEPHVIDLEISSDRMTVFLKVLSIENPEPLQPEIVHERLAESKIVYGVKEAELKRFCEGHKYFIKCKIAAGLPPEKGKDGTVEYHFETNPESRPQEDETGIVNFKDLGIIQNVDEGQLLCTITPPTAGTDGIDVFGNPVAAKAGAMPNITGGKNTSYSEDHLQIFSKVSGHVRLVRNNTIEVDDVWRVRGDVGPETGNIDFEGTVEISGSVLEGFEVQARDDIIVKGLVEGSKLIAGRNVLISEGFNGMKKGIIQAGGNVTCKFIETGNVVCGGEFVCDVALNSNVQAGTRIMLKGKKASLIGGEYVAGERIIANNIGSEKNIAVNVSILPQWEEREKSLEEEIKETTKEMEQIALRREQMKKFDDPSETLQQKTVIMQKLIARTQLLQNEKIRLEKELYKVQLQQDDGQYKIICKGQVHCGVKIVIGNSFLRINNTMSHQCFYSMGGEIIAGQVLPSDEE